MEERSNAFPGARSILSLEFRQTAPSLEPPWKLFRCKHNKAGGFLSLKLSFSTCHVQFIHKLTLIEIRLGCFIDFSLQPTKTFDPELQDKSIFLTKESNPHIKDLKQEILLPTHRFRKG